MVPAGLFGRPRTCTLPRKNPETKNVWFQAFLIWHPHHVPAVDDAVGTNPPAAQNGKVQHAFGAFYCSMPDSRSELGPEDCRDDSLRRAIGARSVRLRIRAENVPHASRTTTIPR